MYFASNDQSQNTFIYQPTIDKWELEKDTAMCLAGNQREYIIPNLSHYILLSWIA